MNLRKLKKKHERSLELIEAINTFNKRLAWHTALIDSEFYQTFPDLIRKYTHRIDIINRCINRLTESYNKLND